MGVFVDTEIADKFLELRHGWDHERHIVPRNPPAGFVVVAVHAFRNVSGRISLRTAAIDGGANVEHDQIGVGEVFVEPLRGHERVGMRARNRNGHRRAEQHRGTEPANCVEGVNSDRSFHDTTSGLGLAPVGRP